MSLSLIDGRTLGEARFDVDVVVVGSGPAGAAVAAVCAGAGLDTLVVEAGSYTAPEDYPADGFTSMARLYHQMGATVTRGRSPMPYLQGQAVGGTSVVNGAISWRLPEDIWASWVEADPALGQAWSFGEVSRSLDEVEKRLSIQPTPIDISGPNNDLLARGAEALELEHRSIRRNVTGCQGLGRCLQGCPEGKKMSMDRSYLVDACKDGARVIHNARVDHILTDRGRAIGVRAGEIEVRSRRTVLAASAIQTPSLLWKSRIRKGPVGHNFMAHPGVSVTGYFDEPVRVWSGATQGREVIGLRREGIKFEALGFDIAVAATRLKSIGARLAEELDEIDHWAHWGAAIKADARGRVRPSWLKGASVRYDLTKRDMHLIRRAIAILGQMMHQAGARRSAPGVFGFDDVVTNEERYRRFEEEAPIDARNYQMVLTHMFGTCRMGSSPDNSVVDPRFQHHAVQDLFVADSSVFPTNTGVNPQTSIIALAALCGERVAS